MADPLSTILTQLSNLVSFKSSIRLLSIAGSIVLSWIYIQPQLSGLNIPNELLITIITIIGFSLGALFISLIFESFNKVTDIINRKKEKDAKTRQELNDIEEKNKRNERKAQLFEASFEEHSHQAKAILLKLLKKDSAIHLNERYQDGHNEAFLGLLESKIIISLHSIDKTTYFCTINPIYKESLTKLFEEKHRKEVKELFDAQFEGFFKLISKFLDVNNDENHVYDIEPEIMRYRYCYSPAIKHDIYADGEYAPGSNIQFYITDEHYPFIVEKTITNLKTSILGNCTIEG